MTEYYVKVTHAGSFASFYLYSNNVTVSIVSVWEGDSCDSLRQCCELAQSNSD